MAELLPLEEELLGQFWRELALAWQPQELAWPLQVLAWPVVASSWVAEVPYLVKQLMLALPQVFKPVEESLINAITNFSDQY